MLRLAGAGLLAAGVAACGGDEKTTAKSGVAKAASLAERTDSEALTWKEARKRLEEGNLRFAEAQAAHPDQSTGRRRKLNSGGQKPFAIVLACADSRVPPELIFDQGLGDLFVVRSAGHVVDRAVLGTVQFGVEEFATPLLVVLGHTKCGAVKATLEAIEKKTVTTGTDVDLLVTTIRPAVVEAEEMGAKGEDILPVAIDNNVERTVALLSQARLLTVAVKSRKLRILGAVYDLATGEVSFM
ncbi:MAG: carbonic anhydrase [Actinomycetota bacterium]|nr:carbonic anhydrase [Actinomycetota bacterium]